MAFLKVQKLVKDGDKVVSGSAAIVNTKYVPGAKYHAKHTVLENLGKVLYLSEDRKEGIFQSPTRGLVQYNVQSNQFSDVAVDDPRIAHRAPSPVTLPVTHTVFGDVYLFLTFLKNDGLLGVLKRVFQKNRDYQRLVGHVIHGVLKDGSKIHCNDFLTKSFASYLLDKVNLESFQSVLSSIRSWAPIRQR